MDISSGRTKGKAVHMKVAGNPVKPAIMNQFGEVMMKDSFPRGQYDIGWIPPVCRMQDEVGLEVKFKRDGTAALVYPTGDEVTLHRDQGLVYISWDDFWPIRKLLAESHRNGRPHSTMKMPHQCTKR